MTLELESPLSYHVTVPFHSQSYFVDIIDRTRTISLEPHRDFQMHDIRKLLHTVSGIRHFGRAAKTALVLETELKRTTFGQMVC